MGELCVETLRVVATDDSELHETMAELKNLSELDVDLRRDIEAGRFDGFFNLPLKWFEVENGPAAGTGEVGVRVKRSERLNNLLAALRTGHIDHARSLADSGYASI
jgi:hypothetical protein